MVLWYTKVLETLKISGTKVLQTCERNNVVAEAVAGLPLTNAPCRFQPVHARHLDIHEYEVEPERGRWRVGFFTGITSCGHTRWSQYVYLCTSKSSKMSFCTGIVAWGHTRVGVYTAFFTCW